MKRCVDWVAPVLLFLVIPVLDVSGQSAVKLDFDKVDPARMLIDPYSYWNQPHSFYYFRHMDEVPRQRIDWIRRSGRAVPLKKSPVAVPATYSVGGRNWNLDDYLEQGHVMAFMVLKDGEIVFERYRNGAGPQDRFISFSVGKSVTSVLFGVAMDEGKVTSVDDPVTKYLPELANTSYRDVTVRNALNMATGVRYDEEYLNPASDVHRLLTALMRGSERFTTMAAAFGAREPERKPGTAFDYQSIDTQILTEILEKVTGKRLAAYAEEKLWKKLGAERDAFIFQSDKLPQSCGFACFNATARDYARFALMAMNNGAVGGTRIVSEKWMRDSTTAPAFANNYGYQWWLNANSRDGAFRAVGIYGQTLYINPAKRVVVVQFSARPRPSGRAPTDPPPPPVPFDAIAGMLSQS
jgi:CubicO group peptidase (beta-lactamase class C family)